MTKKELIKNMEKFADDCVVIIGDVQTGWSNVEKVKKEGRCISIMQDYERPFSGD